MSKNLLREWKSPTSARPTGHRLCLADIVKKQAACPAYTPCRKKDLPSKAEPESCVFCKSGIQIASEGFSNHCRDRSASRAWSIAPLVRVCLQKSQYRFYNYIHGCPDNVFVGHGFTPHSPVSLSSSLISQTCLVHLRGGWGACIDNRPLSCFVASFLVSWMRSVVQGLAD